MEEHFPELVAFVPLLDHLDILACSLMLLQLCYVLLGGFEVVTYVGWEHIGALPDIDAGRTLDYENGAGVK